MRTIAHFAQPDTEAQTLAVLLPGAYNTAEDFQREGFVDSVRERELNVDMVLADMNLECITDGTALTQLREDIILPALSRNYQRVWLVGISIGGFMSMLYADSYPGEINALCLIAPYPGSRMITETIFNNGGLLNWTPTAIAEDDHEAQVWAWLKQYRKQRVDVYLGYGREDRFARAHAEMALALTQDHVCIAGGGHDWTSWKILWHALLDRGVLAHNSPG